MQKSKLNAIIQPLIQFFLNKQVIERNMFDWAEVFLSLGLLKNSQASVTFTLVIRIIGMEMPFMWMGIYTPITMKGTPVLKF